MATEARESPGTLSVEEYARLQEPEEYRSELVRGVLVRQPRPGATHARTQVRLAARLDAHAEAVDGPAGTVFTDVGVALPGMPRTVRGPDIAFCAADRVPDPLPRGFLETAPDLAVEILSPGNSATKMQEKTTEYLGAGVRLVWVVDPSSRTTTVYRSRHDIRIVTEDEVLEGDEVVPGFRVVLRDVLP